jgi:cyclophilin family peptidyl-prolyl cis-trans isomerase/HEAT repeat protein
MSRRAAIGVLLLVALPACRLAAQDEGTVEIYATVLAAQDARRYDEAAFRGALLHPDPALRQFAALAVGRLHDSRGLDLLSRVLVDPDTNVQATAAFAIGLLGAPAGVDALVARAGQLPLSEPLGLEIVTAVARLGGEGAARFVSEVLGGGNLASREDGDLFLRRAAQESWRLGNLAPVDRLVGLVGTKDDDTRIGATYSLSRLRARPAAARLVDATGDKHPLVRQAAARALTRAYADSSGLASESVQDLLVRLSDDPDAGVRVMALRSLATFHPGARAARIIRLLDDPAPNVAVQAADALGDMPGPGVAEALTRVIGGKAAFARKKAALRSLARVDSLAFKAAEGTWRQSATWRERAAVAEAWTRVSPPGHPDLLVDQDPRVVAAALQAWGERVSGPDSAFVASCRERLTASDAAVRAVAAEGVGRAASPGDLNALIGAYRAAAQDSFPDAAIAALGAMAAIAKSGPEARQQVEGRVLSLLPAPADYQIRLWAENEWPAASAAWGPAYPVTTGRTMEDYRTVVRRLVLGGESDRYPSVKLELEGLGTVTLELFGPEAPLTVASFLRLVDRRYFDGMRWHRVVPNFVVQTGDPRGDGWGGPRTVLRDEINQRRYAAYVVGMALSGPDTGGSQWFITLSPQPHLDGGYTVFGKVTDGVPVLLRIAEGDVIRAIHR